VMVEAAFVGNPSAFVQAIYSSPGHPAALIIHGAGAYSGLYLPFAFQLAISGISAILIDLPGHGLSDGLAGDIERYEAYLPAMEDALGWAIDLLKPTRLYVIGESYGGVLAVHLARKRDVDGIILSSPSFDIQIPQWKRRLVLALGRWIPWLRVPIGPTEETSIHPAAAEIVKRNPLIHRRLTARYVSELLRAGRDAIELAKSLKTPVLFLVSAGDRVVDNGVAWNAYNSIPHEHKRWVVKDGQSHALLIDYPEWAAEQVYEWIARELAWEGLEKDGQERGYLARRAWGMWKNGISRVVERGLKRKFEARCISNHYHLAMNGISFHAGAPDFPRDRSSSAKFCQPHLLPESIPESSRSII